MLCELHPEEYQTLQHHMANDQQTAVHHLDGYLGLKAFLPPRERRGVVLIDPPYENPAELTRIAEILPIALKRWATGIYAIWYPIKEPNALSRFFRTIRDDITQPVLKIELTIYPEIPNHLNGCGLLIINPPWQFEQTMSNILPWLWNVLSINGQGEYTVSSL